MLMILVCFCCWSPQYLVKEVSCQLYNQQCRLFPVCDHITWPICVCVCVCVCVCNCLMKKRVWEAATLSAPVSVLECVVKERDLSIVKAECLCVGGPQCVFKFCMFVFLSIAWSVNCLYCLGKLGLSIFCHILKEWPACFVYYVKLRMKYSTLQTHAV